MEFPITLLKLTGSVARLLWGVHMVHSGVQRAFGAQLRGFISNALRSRLKAFIAGLGVTAPLHGSTATGLMVARLAVGGLVDLVPALVVMPSASVVTTPTGYSTPSPRGAVVAQALQTHCGSV